jgi:hypothetical protein
LIEVWARILAAKNGSYSDDENAYFMAHVFLRYPNSPVEQADLLMRPKDSGLGWHYGTGLSNGLVKDVLPEGGKHIKTWDDFCAGKQGIIIRPERSPLEKAIVEQRTLSNVGLLTTMSPTTASMMPTSPKRE